MGIIRTLVNSRLMYENIAAVNRLGIEVEADLAKNSALIHEAKMKADRIDRLIVYTDERSVAQIAALTHEVEAKVARIDSISAAVAEKIATMNRLNDEIDRLF